MIGGRHFLGPGALTVQAARETGKIDEWFTASATADRTPRVGIVLSSFRGSTEHDGTPLKGLPAPRPVDAQLTYAEIDAMVRRAIELVGRRRGRLDTIIGPDDWVVIKPNIVSCHGLGPADGPSHHPYGHGTVTGLRVVKSLISLLAEKKRARVIASASSRSPSSCGPARICWCSAWKRFPKVRGSASSLPARATTATRWRASAGPLEGGRK
jgi:hypothetical protein